MSRYASWGIILDDIIYPDGRSAMGTLGGGGLYAASGMRLWQADAAVWAAVGADFDADSLLPYGFDSRGLLVTDRPTPRAWQLLETDGRRTQIPRISRDAWYDQLVRIPANQPIPKHLSGLHFLTRGEEADKRFLERLAAGGVILSAEPIVAEDSTEAEVDILRDCLPYFTLFSPDELGASALVGERSEREQLRALADMGPKLVALRQGKDGALLYEREKDRFWRVPAASAEVVDVTGAGNGFCGGLLVGWLESGNVQHAAALASVSAAFIIEQVGPPLIDRDVMRRAQERAEEIKGMIRPISEAEGEVPSYGVD